MSSRVDREQWRDGTCGYCGRKTKVNSDHVIAKAIWNVPAEQPIIVDACEDCHSTKSVFEAGLRDFLVLDEDGRQRASDRQLEKSGRSMGRAGSPFLPLLSEALVRPGGKDSVDVDFTHINLAIHWIIRGLYRQVTGHILPEDTPLFAQYFPNQHLGPVLEFFDYESHVQSGSLGQGTTWWKVMLPDQGDDTDDTSYWFISFWDNVHFLVLAGSEASDHAASLEQAALARVTSIGNVYRIKD